MFLHELKLCECILVTPLQRAKLLVLLVRAYQAVAQRGYWSEIPEIPIVGDHCIDLLKI